MLNGSYNSISYDSPNFSYMALKRKNAAAEVRAILGWRIVGDVKKPRLTLYETEMTEDDFEYFVRDSQDCPGPIRCIRLHYGKSKGKIWAKTFPVEFRRSNS